MSTGRATAPGASGPSGNATLLVDGVTKVFADPTGTPVRAVDDVTLEVASGELVSLLGPSGCGKTTLLRIIAGFEAPTAGEVFLAGQRVTHLPPNARECAMVFQSYALFPHLDVFENVAFGLRVRGVGEADVADRVAEALRLVGLGGLERRSPDQLSGGQQQRVALARAVVTRPRLLLLDEPLSNLDAKLREQMRVELRRIQRELGITAIYVTHDQVEAMTLADRIAVLDRGRVQQVAPPAELYARPATPFVAEFVGKVNLLEGTVIAVGDGQCRIALRGLEAVVPSRRPPAPGARVGVVVRPETVHLGREGLWRGVVRRAIYLGSQVEYEVDMGDLRLQAIGRSPLEEGIFAEGETVGVTIGFYVAHLLDLDRR
ncbi:MAG: ABC transporter ATP-binding protein [Armatimonadota bacterium]|nr:ABC transporter ATP-binding protein [Armatimonadota bacterium]MDR7518577.1 ABC transporter ATP-binding protein [Armatimonadota bacterium]MDR7549696.1 ABC transporter ATP-binding protein [Armatimonadota bacterium]